MGMQYLSGSVDLQRIWFCTLRTVQKRKFKTVTFANNSGCGDLNLIELDMHCAEPWRIIHKRVLFIWATLNANVKRATLAADICNCNRKGHTKKQSESKVIYYVESEGRLYVSVCLFAADFLLFQPLRGRSQACPAFARPISARCVWWTHRVRWYVCQVHTHMTLFFYFFLLIAPKRFFSNDEGLFKYICRVNRHPPRFWRQENIQKGRAKELNSPGVVRAATELHGLTGPTILRRA